MSTTISHKQIADFLNIWEYKAGYAFRVRLTNGHIFPGGRHFLHDKQIDTIARQRLFERVKSLINLEPFSPGLDLL